MRWLVAVAAAVLLCGCLGQQNRPLQLMGGAGPVYPPEAKAQGVEGVVIVVYDVGVDGRVINARVVEADPPGIFDEAALAAVRSWKFNAPIENGQVRPAENRRSSVTFKLSGADAYDDY